VTIARTRRAVSRAFGMPAKRYLRRRTRTAELDCRAAVVWVLFELTDMSYRELAHAIERTSHTTASDAVERACNRRAVDTRFRERTDMAIEEVRRWAAR
jgi:chromosomal replication initiation ATPase DnaA